MFAIARVPSVRPSASRGVQQSTRPQREHCSETIKARSVTFRGRDGGRRKSLIRREHRLIGRVYERASERALHRGGRAKPARFPPIIYGDYYFRAVRRERTERQRERRRCDEERGRGGERGKRERERDSGRMVRGNGGVVKRSPVNQIYRRFLSYKAV